MYKSREAIDRQFLCALIDREVNEYPTKYPEGFIPSELADIKSRFPNINEEKFNDALYGITCMTSPEGDTIIYHRDIEIALRCGIENRNLTTGEWD
jgi:hypothetical protein